MFQHSKHGNVDVIAGDDPLGRDTVEDVTNLFEDRAGDGQPHVVLDLARVPYVDSRGLELLLELRDRCVSRGGSLKLAGPNALCKDVLRITRLHREFDVFDDAVSAAGSFAR